MRTGRFFADRRGVMAIEFAMLAPVFLATLLAGMETAFDYYLRFQVDRATQTAMRQIQIGKAPSSATALKKVLCAQLPRTMDCNRVLIDVSLPWNFYYVKWIAQDPSAAGNYTPGKPGDIVLLQVLYAAPAFFPIWFTPTDHFNVGGKSQRVRFIAMNAVARTETP